MAPLAIDLFDNHNGKYSESVTVTTPAHLSLLRKYANRTIEELEKLGVQVCTAERDTKGSDEAGENDVIYGLREDGTDIHIETWNCMGVLRLRDQDSGASILMQIKSRFDKGEGQQFLVYLLSKVFGGVFLDNDIPSDTKSLWDILLALMFRRRLVEACETGLFRQYRVNRYNDMRFRGKFDIDTHLKRNIPFTGSIAYTTRDISFDNPLNHLIRHAMTRISRKWPWVLADGGELTALKHLFEQNTPTWDPNGAYRCTIDKQNRMPVRHPFYASHYEPLRVLSLAILHEEGANPFDADENEIEGFIFDGAWLWEEYLYTLLKDLGFRHPRNKTGTDPAYLFVPKGREVFPDFWKEGFVIDAKYKRLEKYVDIDDLCQIITYMHVLPAAKGYFLYPEHDNGLDCLRDDGLGILNGLGGSVGKIGFPIPVRQATYGEFERLMGSAEAKIMTLLEATLGDNAP